MRGLPISDELGMLIAAAPLTRSLSASALKVTVAILCAPVPPVKVSVPPLSAMPVAAATDSEYSLAATPVTASGA